MVIFYKFKSKDGRCFVSLFTSKTPRQLENKLKLLGFELIDLLLIFLYLSISNLLFGQTTLKIPLVWLGTLVLAIILYFAKKGKPDNYLSDKLSSLVNPSTFSANLPDIKYQLYFKRNAYEYKQTNTSKKL